LAQAHSTRNMIPSFAGRLRELRSRAGLSRAGLAAAAGTGQSAIAMLERGERSPSLELAGRLADAMGTTTDALRAAVGSSAPKRKKKHLAAALDAATE